MRLALVALWLRAAAPDPARATAARCATRSASRRSRSSGSRASRCRPEGGPRVVPRARGARARRAGLGRGRAGARAGIPRHIAERYGLFTIIVLGEAVLAATTGVQAAVSRLGLARLARDDRHRRPPDRLLDVVAVLRPARRGDRRRRARARSRRGCPAPSSGATATTSCSPAPPRSAPASPSPSTAPARHAHLGSLATGFAVTAPVPAICSRSGSLHVRLQAAGALRARAPAGGAALILASSATAEPVLATGLILAVLVAAGPSSPRGRPRRRGAH